MNLVQLFAINNARPPFNDLRVRRALALGLNREEILLGAAWGEGVLLDSALSPAMAGFYHDQLSEINPYDPQRAKELLREADQENLRFTLTLLANYPCTCRPGSWPRSSGSSWVQKWTCRSWSGEPGWSGYTASATMMCPSSV